MQKQLDEIIQRYKNSQTTLEAYEAISDFVKIIETFSGFIEEVESEGEKNRIEQIKLNADKGWDYGLKGKELKLHNEYKARKSEALHQLDPVFPLRNLNNVRLGIQSENIANNSDWLFRWSRPNEPLRESDKKEYQGFIDKLYKKLVPFLEKESTKEIATETISPKEDDLVAWDLDFNSENSILYLGKYEIRISKRKNDKTTGHFILKHIINSDEEISREYSYKEIAQTEFDDNYEKDDAWRKYHHACEYTNEQIRKVTGIDDFLIYTTYKTGEVKINKKYLG